MQNLTDESAAAWNGLKKILTLTPVILGLLVTVFASLQVKQGIEQDAVRQFSSSCDQVTLKIQERLGAYALILRGGAALFAASNAVNRQEWRAYVETLQAASSVPGVQGIGFAQVIQPDELATHINRIREEGFPEYAVRPSGVRAVYTSIIYLEPFRDRNLRAFGFDMYSEPVRRAAMEQARDTGEAALSGKVELVQETGTEVQAGTLMYVPVYRNGMPRDTPGQRRAALIGWAFNPYRMNDLMAGILRVGKNADDKSIDLHIYDGSQATPATLLFDSKTANAANLHSLFYQQRTIYFNGQQWLLVFDHSATVSGINYADAWATLAGGLALSGLLFGLILSMLNTRARAARIADKLTEEIRRREELLKASEYRWKFAIEGSGDGLWDWNMTDSTIFFSKRWKEMLGFAEHEIGTGLDEWKKRIHPEDMKDTLVALQDCLDGKSPIYVSEHRILCKDGSFKWILDRGMVVNRSEDGKPLRMIGTHTDITDRKRVENELRELNNDFVSLLESTSDFIYFKDKDRRFRFCSQTLANITGHHSWRDMIGKHDQEVFSRDIARIYYEEELPVFHEGRALLNKTDPYYDAQGRPGWVRTSKWPVFGEDKKTVVGIFGISRDITGLKEAEEKITELNRDLEQRVNERTRQLEAANKELESFSYSVSHDLRTPLRAIDGFSRILLDDYSDKLDDEGRRLLNVVRENTSRMGLLIDDILKFSRTGRAELSFAEIDMEGLAREVVEELKPAYGLLQLEIEAIPRTQGDRAMMRQVFVNLLSNAIKFSRIREIPKIVVGGSIEGDEAVYYVKDNGAGFDMQYADKLFGVFQRLHSVAEFEGTGIGLAIVKRIVTRHGGRVWAEGKTGEGATIYFALPTGEKNHD